MQEERARRDVQEGDDEVNQNWTVARGWTAKKMLRCLEDSEVSKVSQHERIEGTSTVSRRVEREYRVHCEAGEKTEKQEVASDFQTRSERGPHRQCGEMEEHLKGLVVPERQCLALREEV